MRRSKTHALPIQVMTAITIASTIKMQMWIATNKRDVPRVMKTMFPAIFMVFDVVSSEGHIMPPHIFEVGLKVNTKVYLDVPKSVVTPGAIRWPVADPGCGSRKIWWKISRDNSNERRMFIL